MSNRTVTSSSAVEEDGRQFLSGLISASDLDTLVHVLHKNKRRLPPPSFAAAPPTPLSPWQRVALSAVRRSGYVEADEKSVHAAKRKLAKEVAKYHADVHAREERTRRQQREARAQIGNRLAVAARRFWSRRGDTFQHMMRVEFDLLQRHRDKRKQEDLLRETEELTKKLLDSIIGTKPKESSKGGSSVSSSVPSPTSSTVVSTVKDECGESKIATQSLEETFRQSGKDGSIRIESSLALLNTEEGRRPLRDYQRSALHWMIHLFENNLNGILADEMGLGKTVQTIALLCYYAQYKNDWGPHLVVVPTTVVLNWKAELQRWAPGLKVLTYIGSSKERAKLRVGWTAEDAFHVCITSYNLVVQDRRVFRNRAWGFLVLDEAHQVKNFMSKKWQSLFDLQAEYRLLLTGTPLQNSIMELWSLFHFLLPFASAFRSNDEFKEWFSNPMDDMITGRSSLNEEIVRRLQALIRPFMLRRLKKDVETQLPSKTEKVVLCKLSRRQRSLYDDYMQLAETKERLRSGGGPGGVLSVLLGLRKVCDHPDLFAERPTVSPFVLGRNDELVLRMPRCCFLLGNDSRGRRRFPHPTSLEIVDVNEDESRDGKANYRSPATFLSRGWDDCFSWLSCSLLKIPFHIGLSSELPPSSWSADLVQHCRHTHRGSAASDGLLNPQRLFDESHLSPGPQIPQLKVAMKRCGEQVTTLEKLSSHSPTVAGYAASPNHGLFAAFREVIHAANTAQSAIMEGFEASRRFQRQRCHAERSAIVWGFPRQVLLLEELTGAVLQSRYPGLCPCVSDRARAVLPILQRVAVYVPAAMSRFPPRLHCLQRLHRADPYELPNRAALAPLIGGVRQVIERAEAGRQWRSNLYDGSWFLSELWPAHVRRCFSFPDKRLLIHDCGKLQFLADALKQLRQEGHRALIFTQFVQMLNILERFLALIGVAYLRLDGSTRAEVRQAMVDRFNEDTKLTCMILSTRSGGIGLNLTGADTVIFYDSDWNPTMDLQAQDRCHRIGQTRPVTIYRLISEHTVEEAILEKARERKKLNNVVIRGGQFHSIAGVGEEYDDSAAAFAALSDPVNLRSFFHDYDEDVTLPTVDGETSSSAAVASTEEILAEMGKVEDDEDREARLQLELEMRQRATEEAEEQDDGEGSADFSAGTGSGTIMNGFADVASPNTAAMHTAGLMDEEARLTRIISGAQKAGCNTGNTTGDGVEEEEDRATHTAAHIELQEAGLLPVVRKRQREVLAKVKTPLDRLLTARYGVCHDDDAWWRYEKLCDSYESKLADDEDEQLVDSGQGSVDRDARLFPPFRPRLEL